MLIEIKNRFTDEIIISGEYDNIKQCLKKNKAADLWKADLRRADLRRADLEGVNLRGADLRGANLWGVNLRGADLEGANLRGVNLRGADLRGANLWGVNLRGADLQGADLWKADLRRADLRRANIDFSSWPLWCGSNNVKVDGKIARQFLLHAFKLDLSGDPDEGEYLDCVAAGMDFVSESHRFDEMKDI